MSATIQKINSFVLKLLLTFFVINSVLQSTAVSLKVSNPIIIAILFIVSLLEIGFYISEKRFPICSKDKAKNWASLIKPMDVVIFVFLGFNLIWIFVIPPLKGFLVSEAIREAGMVVMLVLYFPLAIAIRTKRIKVEFYIDVFYYAIFGLAIWHIVMWIWLKADSNALNLYLDAMKKTNLFQVGSIVPGWGIVRVPISNSTMLGVGLLMTITREKFSKIKIIICSATFTFAILATFYRSIWLGLLIGFVALAGYGCYFVHKKNYNSLKNIFLVVASLLITGLVLNYTIFQDAILNRFSNVFTHSQSSVSENSDILESENYSKEEKSKTESKKNTTESKNPDHFSQFNLDEDKKGAIASNNDKIKQSKELIKAWSKDPITGYGFGSYAKDYMVSTNKYVYEMTGFSLLLKVGIIGILVWGGTLIVLIIYAVKNISDIKKRMIWLSVLIYFCAAIQTNPLLFAANSIALFMYLALYLVYQESKICEDKTI